MMRKKKKKRIDSGFLNKTEAQKIKAEVIRKSKKKRVNLVAIGRKILGKSDREKLKQIKNKEDKSEALKYLLLSRLHVWFQDLKAALEDSGHKEKFFMDLEMSAIPAKIQMCKAGFEEEFVKVFHTLKKVEENLFHTTKK